MSCPSFAWSARPKARSASGLVVHLRTTEHINFEDSRLFLADTWRACAPARLRACKGYKRAIERGGLQDLLVFSAGVT